MTRVAVSGAGIAGPTLAYRLQRCGHQPTLIEKAVQLRTGGYLIDFWGVGHRIAERTRPPSGCLRTLLQLTYKLGDWK